MGDAATLDPLDLLRDYIRIDTTNPPGGETKAAELLADVLAGCGLEPQILTSPGGRANLVARLRGDGEPGKALCLLHHIDVVPADADEWSVEPFAADVRDGHVWGRGALDTKSLGVMQLVALAGLVREGVRPRRDVLYVANADEEAGGEEGAGWLCRAHPDLVECEWVLNEGGFGVSEVIPGVSTFGVAVTEKAILWLRLTATGRPGHGSTPHDDQALEHLLAALAAVTRARPLRMTPLVAESFRGLAGQATPAVRAAVEAATSQVGRTVVSLAGSPLAGALPPSLRALLRDTLTITAIHAGYKENVIPGKAEAVVDCRLLPDTDVDEFLADVRSRAARHKVDIEVILRGEPRGIDQGGEMLQWITEAAAELAPGVAVSQTICPGFTDSRFFRELGAHCVGLTPALVRPEIMQGFHGVDERLPLEGLDLGVRMMDTIVRRAVL